MILTSPNHKMLILVTIQGAEAADQEFMVSVVVNYNFLQSFATEEFSAMTKM
jgi:hypothetical protein